MSVLLLPDHTSVKRCYAHQVCPSPAQIWTLLLDWEGVFDMMQLYDSLSLYSALQQDNVVGLLLTARCGALH